LQAVLLLEPHGFDATSGRRGSPYTRHRRRLLG
jgi:hypothetical protein